MSRRSSTFPYVFLDLDGTLTNPSVGIVRSLQYALAALNRPQGTPEMLQRFIGPPIGDVFRELLSCDDPELLHSAIHKFRERFGTIGIFENTLYPGIEGMLETLSGREFSLCLVTSKPEIYARRILDHFGLSASFGSVYGSSFEGLGEDKSTLIRRALKTEAIDPADAVMVGDRRHDAFGAKENGVAAVGVTWGFGSEPELSLADKIVRSPRELEGWLVEGRGCGTTRSFDDTRPSG